MNLYVFQNVLADYSYGMVIIAANSYSQAMEFAVAEFNELATGGSIYYERGWDEPTIYAMGADEKIEPGLKEYVWGGA